MSALDLILRIFGLVLLGSVAALMLRTRRPDHMARIGAALAISVGAFLLTSMRDATQLFGILVLPLGAICATHPVWFWLFSTALFADRPRMTRGHWMCVGAMAIAGAAYMSLPQHRWFGIVFAAASLVFICLGPLAVHAGGRADLDERRRRVRAWFVPVVSVYLAAVVLVQVFVIFRAQSTPPLLVLLNLAVIDAVALLVLLTFLRIRVHNWLDLAEPAPDAAALSRIERSVLERLTRRLVPERLYAREGLTIATLAELLDTQEHVLRRVINRGLGFRNFNDFLHSHRLREAGARLRDPAQRRVPVLTIALEVGYGSIGPFNRAFKERYALTPSEYRRAALRESAAAAGRPLSEAASSPRS